MSAVVPPTGENLPQILKSFLADVYDLNFSQSMEDKIALETQKALNQVLLDNIEFFENYTRKQQAQASERSAPPPPPQQEYAPPPQEQYVPSQFSQPASRVETAKGPPSPAKGRSNYTGTPGYNFMTGQTNGQPTHSAPPRSSMRQYEAANRTNNIFGSDSDPQVNTGRRHSNQVNKQSDPDDTIRRGRRAGPEGGQSNSFAYNEGYGGNNAPRQSAYRSSTTSTTRRETDYADNQRIYSASRNRNQASNIFG
jgi:hypothetical protein